MRTLGYADLARERLQPMRKHEPPVEKQPRCTFYKNQVFQHAAVQVTNLRSAALKVERTFRVTKNL